MVTFDYKSFSFSKCVPGAGTEFSYTYSTYLRQFYTCLTTVRAFLKVSQELQFDEEADNLLLEILNFVLRTTVSRVHGYHIFPVTLMQQMGISGSGRGCVTIFCFLILPKQWSETGIKGSWGEKWPWWGSSTIPTKVSLCKCPALHSQQTLGPT